MLEQPAMCPTVKLIGPPVGETASGSTTPRRWIHSDRPLRDHCGRQSISEVLEAAKTGPVTLQFASCARPAPLLNHRPLPPQKPSSPRRGVDVCMVHFGAVVADAPSPSSTPRSATGQAPLRLGKPARMKCRASPVLLFMRAGRIVSGTVGIAHTTVPFHGEHDALEPTK